MTKTRDLADLGGGFIQARTGAVQRTVESKLQDVVSVKDFGAVGNGIADDTAAIQAAIDRNLRGTIVFPQGTYLITSSILVSNNTIIGLGGTTVGYNSQVNILPTGNFPAFQNKGAGNVSLIIENFFIKYGDTAQTTKDATNNLKYGVLYGAAHPEFSRLRNITVKGGAGAYYDTSTTGGSYLSELDGVFAWLCYEGFYKVGGTTTKIETCYAKGCRRGFYIEKVLGLTLTNCAVDFTNNQVGPGVIHFKNIQCLSIDGMNCESNTIVGDQVGFYLFDNCTGTVSSSVGYNTTASCGPGEALYYYLLTNNSHIHFIGSRVAADNTVYPPPGGSGKNFRFDGTGGTVYSLLATSSSKCTISNSFIESVLDGTGTPTTRYSTAATGGGSVVYTQSDITLSDQVDSYEIAEVESGTFTPTASGFTTTGSPTFTGRYSKLGNVVSVWISINPSGGTVASTSGTSLINLGAGVPGGNPIVPSTCVATNAAVDNYGTGIITTTKLVYPPTWSATSLVVTIYGQYILS
jgi:hypothetical protein